MLDAASAFEPLALQRARGAVHITTKRRGDATVLDRLYQSGSGKARVPRGDGFEAVLLNTAGGVTGGDLFENSVDAAAGTALTVTTQTAERIYRSTGNDARIVNTLTIGAGARLDWLPQETILFDGGRVRRSLTVDMATDATLLAIEPLVLGRTAMGEAVARGFFTDHWRIRRGGALAYADALRLTGDIAALTDAAGALGGARACASLVYIAPDAGDRIDAVREAIGDAGGASAWNGLIAARLLGQDGAALRAALIRAVAALRPGPLPRVWFT